MTGFYLSHPEREHSVIMIRINAFGWRLRRSLDVSVLSKVWDPKSERLKSVYGEYAIINTALEEWNSKANSLIIECKMKLLRPSLMEFEFQLFSGRQSKKVKSIF